MAIGRIFETTCERLDTLFKRKEFNSYTQAFNYFLAIHPYGEPDFGIIGGMLYFIYEKLNLKFIDATSFFFDERFILKINSKEAVFITSHQIITCSNYKTQYPKISLQKSNKIYVSQNIVNEEELVQTVVIRKLMIFISSILADEYAKSLK